jgi:hypothetical protein
MNDKPSTEEFFATANRVLNRRGYLVIGYQEWARAAWPEVGEIVHKFAQFPSPAPLRIVAETNADDWMEQLKTFREVSPEHKRPRLDIAAPGKFFRVVTD